MDHATKSDAFVAAKWRDYAANVSLLAGPPAPVLALLGAGIQRGEGRGEERKRGCKRRRRGRREVGGVREEVGDPIVQHHHIISRHARLL